MKRCYRNRNFRPEALAVIKAANVIIAEYQAEGFEITLRQLYYQFVQRGKLPNTQKEYKRLGDIINDARLAGLIDWDAIEDRGRFVRENSHWDSPQDIITTCSQQFRFDKWAEQECRVEVWVEKDALIGIVEQVARQEDCPAFSCRGYTSVSAMYKASQRIYQRSVKGQRTLILHLGDFDPSGIDMTRDITDRLREFAANDWYQSHSTVCGGSSYGDIFRHCEEAGGGIEVKRIALTREQIDLYKPPPNPAKETDARFRKFQEEHGDESWELDSLEPTVLANLIRSEIEMVRDGELWQEAEAREEEARESIGAVARQWEPVVRFARYREEED